MSNDLRTEIKLACNLYLSRYYNDKIIYLSDEIIYVCSEKQFLFWYMKQKYNILPELMQTQIDFLMAQSRIGYGL